MTRSTLMPWRSKKPSARSRCQSARKTDPGLECAPRWRQDQAVNRRAKLTPLAGLPASKIDPPIGSFCDHPFVFSSGWRGDEVGGFDRPGSARILRPGLVAEADQSRAAPVAQHDPQDPEVGRDGVHL